MVTDKSKELSRISIHTGGKKCVCVCVFYMQLQMHFGNYCKRSSFYQFLQLPVNAPSIPELCNHICNIPSHYQLAHKSVIRIKFLMQLIRIRTNEKLIAPC